MNDKHDMYLEFARVGSAFEVRAVDATDGLEVSFTAPVNAPQHELERLAWQKFGLGQAKNRSGRTVNEYVTPIQFQAWHNRLNPQHNILN